MHPTDLIKPFPSFPYFSTFFGFRYASCSIISFIDSLFFFSLFYWIFSLSNSLIIQFKSLFSYASANKYFVLCPWVVTMWTETILSLSLSKSRLTHFLVSVAQKWPKGLSKKFLGSFYVIHKISYRYFIFNIRFIFYLYFKFIM